MINEIMLFIAVLLIALGVLSLIDEVKENRRRIRELERQLQLMRTYQGGQLPLYDSTDTGMY